MAPPALCSLLAFSPVSFSQKEGQASVFLIINGGSSHSPVAPRCQMQNPSRGPRPVYLGQGLLSRQPAGQPGGQAESKPPSGPAPSPQAGWWVVSTSRWAVRSHHPCSRGDSHVSLLFLRPFSWDWGCGWGCRGPRSHSCLPPQTPRQYSLWSPDSPPSCWSE